VKKSKPRPGNQTARQQRSKAYREEWEKNKRIVRKSRGVRGPELAAALERALQATGDLRFADAACAVHAYGLDRKFEHHAKIARAKMFGDPLDGYLTQVAFLAIRGKLERGKRKGGKLEREKRRPLSVREACECVVAETGFPATSFDTAVERLRKAYLAGPRPDIGRPLDLGTAMMSLWARRISRP
jgi:hypothetical protein